MPQWAVQVNLMEFEYRHLRDIPLLTGYRAFLGVTGSWRDV